MRLALKAFLSDRFYFAIRFLTRIHQIRYPIPFYTWEQTVRKVQKGYSISRFGDGEMNLMLQKSPIDFQKMDSALAGRLKEILALDMRTTPGFLIAITPLTGTYKGYAKSEVKFWAAFNLFRRKKLFQIICRNQTYYDALFARLDQLPGGGTENEFYEKTSLIQTIWHGKRVLIVEGEYTKLGVNSDLLYHAKSIMRVIVPARNAFDYYDEIIEEIRKRNGYDMILLIMGPTATVMAYDLYLAGKWAVDLGQIQASYIAGVLRYGGKPEFQNKILTEDEYKHQIVQVIGPVSQTFLLPETFS